MEAKHHLLICTVGGSPEPIVASLKHWNPARVHFVPSREARSQIEERVIPTAQAEGFTLAPGGYDVLELPDSQDFSACVERLWPLNAVIAKWLGRGDDYAVVVDFTGGTKCMTAALALVARRWRCTFSYVGGTERTKDGLGVVVAGKESVLHRYNPWDSLGLQALEDFVPLFDRYAFAAAAELADRTKRYVDAPRITAQFAALEMLAKGYDAWDRFDHKAAMENLCKDLPRRENDLRAVFPGEPGDRLVQTLHKHGQYLQRLVEEQAPSKGRVIDLLANGLRRKAEGRFDDAVARLYRAIEALAQVALHKDHQIDTKSVPVESIPEPLRAKFHAAADGTVSLGLRHAYDLLDALGHPVGRRFKELGLDTEKSPLVSRNQSILAHGWDRVSDKAFDQLWKCALTLADTEEHQLPQFPRLGQDRQSA